MNPCVLQSFAGEVGLMPGALFGVESVSYMSDAGRSKSRSLESAKYDNCIGSQR